MAQIQNVPTRNVPVRNVPPATSLHETSPLRNVSSRNVPTRKRPLANVRIFIKRPRMISLLYKTPPLYPQDKILWNTSPKQKGPTYELFPRQKHRNCIGEFYLCELLLCCHYFNAVIFLFSFCLHDVGSSRVVVL